MYQQHYFFPFFLTSQAAVIDINGDLVKDDESIVVSWGHAKYGGIMPSSLQDKMYRGFKYEIPTKSAIDSGKTVLDPEKGKFDVDSNPTSPLPHEQHYNKVKAVFSTCCAFAAILEDASVLAWGDLAKGGQLTETHSAEIALGGGARKIYSNNQAFV